MLFLRQHVKLVRAHGDTKNFTDLVGAFLIAAGDNCFFGFGGFWEAPAWHAFYDQPIGKPSGEAVYASGVWRRSFEHVEVTFDTATNTSSIRNRSESAPDVAAIKTDDSAADGGAGCFPMLPPGVHAGINGPGSTPAMAAAYAGIVKSGGDLAQIGVTWADVEPKKGEYDFRCDFTHFFML